MHCILLYVRTTCTTYTLYTVCILHIYSTYVLHVLHTLRSIAHTQHEMQCCMHATRCYAWHDMLPLSTTAAHNVCTVGCSMHATYAVYIYLVHYVCTYYSTTILCILCMLLTLRIHVVHTLRSTAHTHAVCCMHATRWYAWHDMLPLSTTAAHNVCSVGCSMHATYAVALRNTVHCMLCYYVCMLRIHST